VLAFESGDFDRAQAHFLVAAILKPKPPKLLDVAPPPRRVERYYPERDRSDSQWPWNA
jgi:hypothetical protein